ncbi:Homocysteine S-methyltransferase [Gonapodya prolifera JEL478]|uniref:Homocysteine S-methyltransferase n=1 Tax=Gonapodya prolifera (strain JEL478) TaxID=1344416 RepID=A0A139AQI0_GONPJ|nr:Homocysteine S-methyltransferase [Gonapodya prolifera JEL478]|eukprot:KXS18999.1 Homocysteine S-methyltransferase [Gonapodya prolifera JEL478]
MASHLNPLLPFLKGHRHAVVLDGGLATELEAKGKDLNDSLWSAKELYDDPDCIRDVHLDYYRAGADVATTASYQGTVAGFVKRGYSESEAEELLRRSVSLAFAARSLHLSSLPPSITHPTPLVAISSGPYGAALHDGSEYTGSYIPHTSESTLRDFHAARLRVLFSAPEVVESQRGDYLVALETFPSVVEARAALALFETSPPPSGSPPGEFAGTPVLVSFTFHVSGASTCYGESIADVARVVRDSLNRGANLVAVGCNCTAPRAVPRVVRDLRAALVAEGVEEGRVALLAYPNRGEEFDVMHNEWHPIGGDGSANGDEASSPEGFGKAAKAWRKLGCEVIGGCCRTTPAHIRALVAALEDARDESSVGQNGAQDVSPNAELATRAVGKANGHAVNGVRVEK